MTSPASASVGAPNLFSKWRRAAIFSEMLLLVVLLFYGEEDWRGKQAWEKCKRDLAAKGQHLDAQYFILPHVPDDQNVLKAPKMADWFGGHFYVGAPGTDLSARLSSRPMVQSLAIAQIRVVAPGTNPTNVSVITTAWAMEGAATNVAEEIKLDSVSLTDAIRALAMQTGLNIIFDPVLFQAGVTPGVLARNPKVTANWRKVTAAQALSTLLNNYGMELAVDATTHVARVKPVDPAAVPSPQATLPANAGASGPLGGADLVLDFDSSGKIINPRSDGPGAEVVGVVSFENVLLTDAIRAIAVQAHRNILFDPALTQDASTNGPLTRNPTITEKWINISPDQALFALLANWGMVLMEDPVTHLDRVTAGDSAEVRSAAQRFARRPDVHAAVASLLHRAQGLSVLSPIGYLLAQNPLDQIKPIRIVFRSKSTINSAEIESFIKEFLPEGLSTFGGLVVTFDPADREAFQAVIQVESAADFLAWSDKLEPEFDLIRQGLRRPQSQRENYQDYFQGPQQLPSFITVRTVAQALAERAQCHLLLGQPDLALRDLTLVHDLPRAIITRPTGFVDAMITVAVGGLYTEAVADGLRLQAWREPELAALEAQLKSINWLALVSEALATERVLDCQRIGRMTPPEYGTLLTNWFNSQQASQLAGSKSVNPFLRLVPRRWIFPQNHWLMDKLFAAIPRGWRYQNMVVEALLKQELIDSIDLSNGLILPGKAGLYGRDVDLAVKASSPFAFVASLFAANESRSVSTTAHNQTAVNQACVACALERYRLALGQYPEALDALVPRFIGKIPRDLIGGQPLKYRREPDGTFLLYSIGWNEGTTAEFPGKGIHILPMATGSGGRIRLEFR